MSLQPCLLCLSFLLALRVGAADLRESLSDALSLDQRRALNSLNALSAGSLKDLENFADPKALESDVNSMWEATRFALSLRSEEDLPPSEFLRTRLEGMEGVQVLGELKQPIPVPVQQQEALLEVGEQRLPLSPFWPNGALPNAAPLEGLSGPLVYVGDAEWDDLRGKDPRNAIVVMNFSGGRNWSRVFSLGAQAVLVLEDDSVSRPLAERFFAATPLPCPRFLVRKEFAESLKAAEGQDVRLLGGNAYEARTARSVFAWLPPDDFLKIEVREGDLLERISAQFGIQARDLLDENGLDSAVLSVGQKLEIPGRDKPYTVSEQDLLKRLAKEYSVSVDALKGQNDGMDLELPAGTVLEIPPLVDPMLFLIRMDGVSSVPGEAHGASVLVNVVAGLRLLEQAIAMPEGSRRRGMLIAFLEGDNHGGRASRALVETWLERENSIGQALVAEGDDADEAVVYGYYQTLAEWWLNSERELDDSAALWFSEDWLSNRLETYRVSIAEARVAAIKTLLEPDLDPAGEVYQTALSTRKALEAQLNRLVEFRKNTLGNKDISSVEQIRGFLSGVDENLGDVAGVSGITAEALLKKFSAELTQETQSRSFEAENLATLNRLLETLYPEGRAMSSDNPLLGYWIDLSDGSRHLSLESLDDMRGLKVVRAKAHRAIWTRLDSVYALASLQAGWNEEWCFVGPGVEALFPVLPRSAPPSYKEFWAALGVGLLDLRTVNDTRRRVDTHLDVPELLRYDQLAIQFRTLMLLSRVALESARDGELSGRAPSRPFSRLVGMTTKFNVRSGIDAKDPVPSSLVMLPSIPAKVSAETGSHNTSTYMGNRIAVMKYSRLNGRFSMPIETTSFKELGSVFAYRPDLEEGLFEYVMEGGQIGTQRQSQKIQYIEGRDTWKNLILYPMYPLVVSPGVEPLQYSAPNEGTLPDIQDAVLKGTPRHLQVEHPKASFREEELDGMIVYMEPGRKMVMLDKRQGSIRGLLLGPLDPENENSLSGTGVPVGPLEDNRNVVLPLASLEIATSLQEVNDRRERIYSNFGIRDTGLFEALEMSRLKIEEAEAWKEKMDWQRAVGASREAWGLLIKNYPGMLKLGREAVLSVVLLMALMAPTCVFLERLVIGSKHIISRLGFAVLLFGIGTVFLNFFHPAFMIAASPIIVVIAFAMILMAVVVLGICYQRFEVLVRRARIEGGEAESEEISLASTLNTAFNLGVSNLKKRPTRTFLTAFTVTVLTFSIVSFVSVKGTDTLFLRPVPLDLRVKGVELPADQIESPAYEGVLFREFSWAGVSGSFMDAVQTEFGSRYPLARRMHYIQAAGGNNATKEGTNQIEIRASGNKEASIVTALMGFEAVETEFSGLNRAVADDLWFQEGDRNHIILPKWVAEEQGITAADLIREDGTRRPDDELPEVLMMSQLWKVVGILDSESADRIRDVNGKPLALVDYLASAITPSMGSGRLETEDDLVHMSWEDLAIVPVSARQQVRGSWNSLAIRFPEDFDFAAFRNELARRTDRAMYAHVDGELSLLSARKQSSVGGLAKVLVPIVLCVLIVSNTMMGTVDERVGEVQMLGAIGLSPSQISFLLLAESTVFSCIGIIFGTFSGLMFSKIASFFPGSLGELSFNFTSLASTFLAMGTGAIVLVATLLPAKRAAALAAPSGMDKWKLPDPGEDGMIHFELPFTLTRGNAVGMGAFFRRFLLNHVDSSSADFISKGNHLSHSEAAGDGLGLDSHMWLAPYDLDVAQDLKLDIEPTGHEGVFGVTIHLKRISGTEDAWLRTNYGFLNLVRKQFLLWRNLEPDLRKRYIQEGSVALENRQPESGAAS